MSIFIACIIPESAVIPIREAMRSYQDVLEKSAPQERWHCTMLFLGDADISPEAQELLCAPIRQSFHPVITVLSLGQGKAHGQLWAYIQAQAFLADMRAELIQRAEKAGILLPPGEGTKDFIPHIHTGGLQLSTQPATIPDMPVKTAFSLSELVLLKSSSNTSYEQLGRIPITP